MEHGRHQREQQEADVTDDGMFDVEAVGGEPHGANDAGRRRKPQGL